MVAQKNAVLMDATLQAAVERLQLMCTGLVTDVVTQIDESKAIFSDKSVWSFMREYEKLKNREKALKNLGFSSSVLTRSHGYRKIIKQFAKRMLDPDFKSQFSGTKTSFFSNKQSLMNKRDASGESVKTRGTHIEDEVENMLKGMHNNDNKGDDKKEAADGVIVLEESKNLKDVSD